MTLLYGIGLLLSAGLMVYLLVALLLPEKFS
ncbi:MAG: K(+)-transporting ATPase subunit F [Phycisphaerae bacterium]